MAFNGKPTFTFKFVEKALHTGTNQNKFLEFL